MRFGSFPLSRLAAACLALTSLTALAQGPTAVPMATDDGLAADEAKATTPERPVALDTVEVRAAPLVQPVATPKFVLDAEDIQRLNIRNIADLFAQIPGAQSHTFGQGDIGNPFILRGFSSDHGSQVAIYIDGVPQNLPSSSVGANGMAEYTWLTLELIERVEVVEGPATALAGDQALAGSVFITTKLRSGSEVIAGGGSYGLANVTAILGQRVGGTDLIAAAEGQRADGYRARSGYQRGNVTLKAARPTEQGTVTARLNYYESDFDASGYLDFDRLRAGLVDPRTSLFPSDGGRGQRAMAVLNFVPKGAEGLTVNAYFDHIERARYGSFAPTNFQTETRDLRNVFGTRGYYNWQYGEVGNFLLGYEYRNDTGDHGSFRTVDRQRTGLVNRNYHLELEATSFYAQGSVQVLPPLRLLGGVRYDYFDQDIENRLTPRQSGDGGQEVASPNVGVVFTVTPGLDLTASYGTGFRSLAVTELSPVSPTRAQGFDFEPPRVTSRDAAVRSHFGGFTLNLSAYTSTVDDEIRETAPGTNVFENAGNTKRQGYLVDGSYQINPRLKIDASYSHIHARVVNPLVPGQDRVTSNPRSLATAGVHYTQPVGAGLLRADLYLQEVGPKPYYVAGLLRETTRYQEDNLRIGYELGRTTYTAFATYRPREFASDQAGASFNPVPDLELGGEIRYRF